ncbi:MAG: peptidoglycan DD-metalloendopeptidase family protein [bacterium]
MLRTTGKSAVACLVLAAGIGWSGGATDSPARGAGELMHQIDASSTELATIRGRIEEHRQQLQLLSDDEHAIAEKLAHLDQEMGLIKDLLARLDEREKMLGDQSESLQAMLGEHESTYLQRQDVLGDRLRSLYKRGPTRHLELILTAESFSSLITRLKFTTTMARLEGRFMASTRDQKTQILAEQQQLQAALAGIWETREETTQEQMRLERVDGERRAMLDELRRQKEAKEAELVDLQGDARQLTDLLAGLELQRQSHSVPEGTPLPEWALQIGDLDWPVHGEVVKPFGRTVHSEFQTVTVNSGLNIAAPQGAPVFAIAPGQVEFADYLPGFGLCVILDHGAGYYSLYAYLDQVFVGQAGQVSQGEILAEVGSPPGEGRSQLYFEIRQGKSPLDPTTWLKPR